MKYYEESYGIKILNKNQPLVEVVIRVDKKIENGVVVENEVKGYLIPELIAATGMSDEQRKHHKTMQAIAPITKLSPNDRLKEKDRIIELIAKTNKKDIVIGNHRKFVGYLLNEPSVRLNSQ